MLLCEGTAIVLDMVRPKAQLLLTACKSEWGPGRPEGSGRRRVQEGQACAGEDSLGPCCSQCRDSH
jgi:hypothetical protein